MKVVAIVGLCGAGKSVVTDEFLKLGYERVYFGGITMEVMKERNLEINEANERMVRESLREEHGMAAYAVLSLPKIEEFINQGKNVIIDGLYSWSEYTVLREKFGEKLKVIAVYASPKTRHHRLAIRDVRPLTNSEAESRDKSEIENIEKAGPIVIADFTIMNEGTMEKFKEEINKLIEVLK